MRSRAPFFFALVVLSTGCRDILGIEERPVMGGAAGTSGTGGGGGTSGIAGAGGTGLAGQSGAAGASGGSPVACSPGATQCDAKGLSTCAGSGWSTPQPCPTGLGCASSTACLQVGRVALGSSHSCAALDDGTVRCWGDDGQGQCGVTSSADVIKPSSVMGANGSMGLSLGDQTSCAITADKTVQCWGGSNGVGALGNNTTDSSIAPVAVKDEFGNLLGGVVSLALGARHACAAQESSAVLCWGDNSMGQLGKPSSTALSTVAVPQPGVSGAVEVAAGAGFTCARLSSGAVQCWGDGSTGQLGGAASSATPVTVLDKGAKRLAAGARHACALLDTGEVKCWGDDSAYQCGGAASGQGGAAGQGGSGGAGGALPTKIKLTGTVTDLALGDAHSCAIVSGAAWCWGENRYGQVGWAVTQAQATPRQVNGVQDATGIAAGRAHTCAWGKNRPVSCWGEYLHGQLGNGDDFDTATPHVLGALPGKQKGIALGGAHGCALDVNGAVECWGWNAVGQLGTGTGEDQGKPVPTSPAIKNATAITAGLLSTCASVPTGLECWGYAPFGNTVGFVPTPIALGGSAPAEIALGDEHACVRRVSGDVACAGRNDLGQSGVPGMIEVSWFDAPVLVGATAVAVGARHSCAIGPAGKVSCWGDNGYGQLGVATPSSSAMPQDVPLPAPAVALALGANHSCADLGTAGVLCWGDNGHGQLGHMPGLPTSKPTAVDGALKATALAAGAFHTCAIVAGTPGNLRCWGAGDDGQLGLGKGNRFDKGTPAGVTLPGPATALALGAAHTCAIIESGQLACWGYGGKGQLGLGEIGFSFETTSVKWQ
jgi:alpha-tubulin suppressor-like RCC1 family protein